MYLFVANVFGIFLQQSLTNGSGFYEATSKELWTEGRKIVIKHKDTEEYFDDFSGVSKGGWIKRHSCRHNLFCSPFEEYISYPGIMISK